MRQQVLDLAEKAEALSEIVKGVDMLHYTEPNNPALEHLYHSIGTIAADISEKAFNLRERERVLYDKHPVTDTIGYTYVTVGP